MIKNLIISRTDSLGDVILTLPTAGLMKKLYPNIKIYFIGRSYTQPLIEACEFVDEFINWDEVSNYPQQQQIEFFKSLKGDAIVHVFPDEKLARIAYKSNIPIRIGTSHRIFHWFYCNKRLPIGRKKSDLHEAQLNLQLFIPLGAKDIYSLDEIPEFYGLSRIKPINGQFKDMFDPNRFNLILHPKSRGSAREWGLDNFGELINLLPKDKFKIFISGTNEDSKFLTPLLDKYKNEIVDITGQMSLIDFISFIGLADGLVAASTGPLHIAAAMGKKAVGLYAPMRPIHPGRWSPIGTKSDYLVLDKQCKKCKQSSDCECIRMIKPQDVADLLGKRLV
jgi:ADP-heptose:LPS heptosyltransferase